MLQCTLFQFINAQKAFGGFSAHKTAWNCWKNQIQKLLTQQHDGRNEENYAVGNASVHQHCIPVLHDEQGQL